MATRSTQTTAGVSEPLLRHRPAPPSILLGDIVRITRTHPPPKKVERRNEPEMADDCLVVRHRNLGAYGLVGTPEWVSYAEIVEAFRAARAAGTTSHIAPAAEADVFAPTKLLIRERTHPLRAVLLTEPAYPWRAKLAVARDGVHIWLVYAACAVLNSDKGQGLYAEAAQELGCASRSKDGVNMDVLRRIPIARAGHTQAELARVADLVHQIVSLGNAEVECRPLWTGRMVKHPSNVQEACRHFEAVFTAQRVAVTSRLEEAVSHLLGLDERREVELQQAAQLDAPMDLHAQQEFDFDWMSLPTPPPPPPVELRVLDQRILDGWNEDEALKLMSLLAYWESVVNSRPARDMRRQRFEDGVDPA